MKLLKALFVQRFNMVDVVTYSILWSIGGTWVSLLIAAFVLALIDTTMERVLDIRHMNGNSPLFTNGDNNATSAH